MIKCKFKKVNNSTTTTYVPMDDALMLRDWYTFGFGNGLRPDRFGSHYHNECVLFTRPEVSVEILS